MRVLVLSAEPVVTWSALETLPSESDVVITNDGDGYMVGTVFFKGSPVLVVYGTDDRRGDYEIVQPQDVEGLLARNVITFLLRIGNVDEEAAQSFLDDAQWVSYDAAMALSFDQHGDNLMTVVGAVQSAVDEAQNELA